MNGNILRRILCNLYIAPWRHTRAAQESSLHSRSIEHRLNRESNEPGDYDIWYFNIMQGPLDVLNLEAENCDLRFRI